MALTGGAFFLLLVICSSCVFSVAASIDGPSYHLNEGECTPRVGVWFRSTSREKAHACFYAQDAFVIDNFCLTPLEFLTLVR
ncbi:hypothetical protein M758_6G038000 [Ceratodon purpureus]|nr:hypothetical protein M758_6G038000 [Ceratodon purpureus]